MPHLVCQACQARLTEPSELAASPSQCPFCGGELRLDGTESPIEPLMMVIDMEEEPVPALPPQVEPTAPVSARDSGVLARLARPFTGGSSLLVFRLGRFELHVIFWLVLMMGLGSIFHMLWFVGIFNRREYVEIQDSMLGIAFVLCCFVTLVILQSMEMIVFCLCFPLIPLVFTHRALRKMVAEKNLRWWEFFLLSVLQVIHGALLFGVLNPYMVDEHKYNIALALFGGIWLVTGSLGFSAKLTWDLLSGEVGKSGGFKKLIKNTEALCDSILLMAMGFFCLLWSGLVWIARYTIYGFTADW